MKEKNLSCLFNLFFDIISSKFHNAHGATFLQIPNFFPVVFFKAFGIPGCGAFSVLFLPRLNSFTQSFTVSYEEHESHNVGETLSWIYSAVFPSKKRTDSHHELQFHPFFTFTRNAYVQTSAKQWISVRMIRNYGIFMHRKETVWPHMQISLAPAFSMQTKLFIESLSYDTGPLQSSPRNFTVIFVQFAWDFGSKDVMANTDCIGKKYKFNIEWRKLIKRALKKKIRELSLA